MSDDRERLYALCKEFELDVHHKSGVEKLMAALDEAGVEYEKPAPQEAPKPKPAKQSDAVEVIVMVKNVHVRAEQVFKPAQEMSIKLFFKERHKMDRATAERLAGRDQVEIIG